MAGKLFVINGPNLNALGLREPTIYGKDTLDDIARICREEATALGFNIEFRQSNHEGDLIDWLQEADRIAVGVALNPGAYGHTSIAIHDAIRSMSVPVVELHLSNIHAREPFRHRSMVAPVVRGVICGFGPASYTLAIRALVELNKK